MRKMHELTWRETDFDSFSAPPVSFDDVYYDCGLYVGADEKNSEEHYVARITHKIDSKACPELRSKSLLCHLINTVL